MTRPALTARGEWPPGLAYFRLGAGAQTVFFPGLSGTPDLPSGADMWMQRQLLAPLARSRELIWMNRRRDLTPPTTIARIAEDSADAIRAQLSPPVDVIGLSTGGSVALQLAVDHPELVRRLVVVASACRLSDEGRRVQRRLGAAVRAGRPRQAGAAGIGAMAAGSWGVAVFGAVGWLMGRGVFGRSGADLLALVDAEDTFDVTDRLGEITARTLIVGAERDRYYSADLFRRTAEGIPHAQLVLYPRTGHLGTTLRRRYYRDVREFLDGP